MDPVGIQSVPSAIRTPMREAGRPSRCRRRARRWSAATTRARCRSAAMSPKPAAVSPSASTKALLPRSTSCAGSAVPRQTSSFSAGGVDALGDVRQVGVVRGDGGRRHHARPVPAARGVLEAVRVVEREGVGAHRREAQPLVEARDVEVAQEARLAHAADRRRRAPEDEAQLAPGDLILRGAAGGHDRRVPVRAEEPLVPVLVSARRCRACGSFCVYARVIVRVDEARRDHARRAGDAGRRRRGGRARRIGGAGGGAAHLRDGALSVHEHLTAAVDRRRREHGAGDQRAAVAGGDRAGAARERREGLARHVRRHRSRQGAVGVAGGAVVDAVVALLHAELDEVVAAARLDAGGEAGAVVVVVLAVVALLAGLDLAVDRRRPARACRRRRIRRAGLAAAVAARVGGEVSVSPSPLMAGIAWRPAQPASRRLKTRLGAKGYSLRMTLLRSGVRDGPRRVP